MGFFSSIVRQKKSVEGSPDGNKKSTATAVPESENGSVVVKTEEKPVAEEMLEKPGSIYKNDIATPIREKMPSLKM